MDHTTVAVELTLPASAKNRKRVSFELYAITPNGDEKISTAEGFEKGGKAEGKIPVYIPSYRDAENKTLSEVDYWVKAIHPLAAAVENRSSPAHVKEKSNPYIDSSVIESVTFSTDSSFIRPDQTLRLTEIRQQIRAWKKQYRGSKVAIFGHADKVGDESYNKSLSDKRALSVHGFLVCDVDIWESLYNQEKWGLKKIQECLKFLGFDPGPVDGLEGPKTKAAVQQFQQEKGLLYLCIRLTL